MGWYTKANGSGTKVLETDIVTDEKNIHCMHIGQIRQLQLH